MALLRISLSLYTYIYNIGSVTCYLKTRGGSYLLNMRINIRAMSGMCDKRILNIRIEGRYLWPKRQPLSHSVCGNFDHYNMIITRVKIKISPNIQVFVHIYKPGNSYCKLLKYNYSDVFQTDVSVDSRIYKVIFPFGIIRFADKEGRRYITFLHVLSMRVYTFQVDGKNHENYEAIRVRLSLFTKSNQSVQILYSADKLNFSFTYQYKMTCEIQLIGYEYVTMKYTSKYKEPCLRHPSAKYYPLCNQANGFNNTQCDKFIHFGILSENSQVADCRVTKPDMFLPGNETEPTLVGLYDHFAKEFKMPLNKQMHKESFHGPTSTSATEAHKECKYQNATLQTLSSYVTWRSHTIGRTSHIYDPTVLRKYYPWDISIYTFQFWIIQLDFEHLTNQLKDHYEKGANCNKLRALSALVTTEYTFCHRSKCSKQFVQFVIPDYVLNDNIDIFCNNYILSIQERLQQYDTECAALTRNDYTCFDTLLFIPCNLVLHNSGYVCDRMKIEQEDILNVQTAGCHSSTTDHKMLREDIWNHVNVHTCGDSTYLLNHYVCDGIAQCTDGNDEYNCTDVRAFFQPTADIYLCFTSCHFSNCTCSYLYFQCEMGGCIPSSKICDGHYDCHDDSDESDEHSDLCLFKLSDIYKNKTKVIGYDSYYGYCLTKQHGHYSWSKLEAFQICDGTVDCLHGVDEWTTNCSSLVFLHSLRCAGREPFPFLRPRHLRIMKQKVQEYTYFTNLTSMCSTYDDILLWKSNKVPELCKMKGTSLLCKNVKSIPSAAHVRWLVVRYMHEDTNIQINDMSILTVLEISDSTIAYIFSSHL